MAKYRPKQGRPRSRTYEPDVPSSGKSGNGRVTSKTTTTKTTTTKRTPPSPTKAAGWAMDVATFPSSQVSKAVIAAGKSVPVKQLTRPRGPLKGVWSSMGKSASGMGRKAAQLAKSLGQTYK